MTGATQILSTLVIVLGCTFATWGVIKIEVMKIKEHLPSRTTDFAKLETRIDTTRIINAIEGECQKLKDSLTEQTIALGSRLKLNNKTYIVTSIVTSEAKGEREEVNINMVRDEQAKFDFEGFRP